MSIRQGKPRELIEIKISELEVITDPRLAKEKGHLLIPSRTFRMGDITAAWSGVRSYLRGKG
ncbi:MAG: hypothetical protein MZV63_49265 [Marinilabiliales bacterium]|nr:hypothetical protein [Marinilabiliales bacterium]